MNPERAGSLLRESDYTLATAESLTGGNVGAQITSVPGASDYFLGGVIAYAPFIKAKLLSVPEEVIAKHGVVSQETATAMAVGVRDLFGASFGVATTGVAGPDSLEGHPAGTVCLAVAGPLGTESVMMNHQSPADRQTVITWATSQAIDLLIRHLRELARQPR
jgi:PncC family amidohydrolase